MKSSTYPSLLGLGSYLPAHREWADEAISCGACFAGDLYKSGVRAVSVETEHYPADMALLAAQAAIADHPGEQLDWLLYSHINYQGQPRLWSPAAYLNRHLGTAHTRALNISQGCNGQMLSLEVACRLLVGQQRGNALCVAADRFNTSGFRRWQADYGIVYGDGAAAALIGHDGPAIADILGIESLAASELEGMHRLEEPAPEGHFDPDDIRRDKKLFLAKHGIEPLVQATHFALHELWQRLVEQTGVARSDISHLLLPHLGRQLLEDNYLSALNLPRAHHNLESGLEIGHLGCADPLVSMDQLLRQPSLAGELVLLVGAGAGFSWTLCLMRLR